MTGKPLIRCSLRHPPVVVTPLIDLPSRYYEGSRHYSLGTSNGHCHNSQSLSASFSVCLSPPPLPPPPPPTRPSNHTPTARQTSLGQVGSASMDRGTLGVDDPFAPNREHHRDSANPPPPSSQLADSAKVHRTGSSNLAQGRRLRHRRSSRRLRRPRRRQRRRGSEASGRVKEEGRGRGTGG